MRDRRSPLAGIKSPIKYVSSTPVDRPQLNHLTDPVISVVDGKIVVQNGTLEPVASQIRLTLTFYHEGASMGDGVSPFETEGRTGDFHVIETARAVGYSPSSAQSNTVTIAPSAVYPFIAQTEWAGGEATADVDTRRAEVVVALDPPVPDKSWAFIAGTAAELSGAIDDVVAGIVMLSRGADGQWSGISGLRFEPGQTDAAVRLVLTGAGGAAEWATPLKAFQVSDSPTALGPGDWTVQAVPNGLQISIIDGVDWGGREGAYTVLIDDVPIGTLANGIDTGARFVAFEGTGEVTVEIEAVNVNGSAVSDPKSITIEEPTTPTQTVIDFENQQLVFEGNLTTVRHVDGPVAIISASPVRLISKTPATTGSGSSLRHGIVKGPRRNRFGFDGRAGNFQSADAATLPLDLAPGEVALAARSRGETLTNTRDGVCDTFAMVYVTETAPDPNTLAPAAIRWTGRLGFSSPAAVDYLAKAAELPIQYGIGSATYRDKAYVTRNLRFNPSNAITRQTAASGGYEENFPYRWTGSGPYGREAATNIGEFLAHLIAPIEQVPLEVKAEILMRLDSFGNQTIQTWDGAAETLPQDGGHNQFQQICFFIHYWLRGNNAKLETLTADYSGGNWGVGMYRVITQEMVDTWWQPWGDADNPSSLLNVTSNNTRPVAAGRRRLNIANAALNRVGFLVVKGGSGGNQGDGGKNRYTKMRVKRLSDGFSALAVETTQPGTMDNGDQITFTLDAWPDPGFAVGDIVHLVPHEPWVAGMPEWFLSERIGGYSPSSQQSYRGLQRAMCHLIFVQVLGQMRADWRDRIWNYCLLAQDEPNWPSAENNHPPAIGDGTLMPAIWSQYKAQIKAVPQPYIDPVFDPEEPEPVFYPNVPPVDLNARAGSLLFPEGNDASAGANVATYKGALSQPVDASFPNIQASTLRQASFAVVRWDRSKRANGDQVGIFGNGGTTDSHRWWMQYIGDSAGTDPNVFRFYQRGQSGSKMIYSQPWTEDAALVVAWCDGADNWQLDWYSLADGSRIAGTPSAGSVGFMGDPTSNISIGHNSAASNFNANGAGRKWGGEIEMVGYVRSTTLLLDPAIWQRIALGANPEDIFPLTNMGYYRKLKGADLESRSPLPVNTSDLTQPAIPYGSTVVGIPASWLRPGSHIRRQSETQWLLPNRLEQGHVFAWFVGQDTREVAFSGKSAGCSGNAQVQVYEADTGRVVLDWTTLGPIDGVTGDWSGSVDLPKAERWWWARFRPSGQPSLVAEMRSEFAVGYKIMVLGQSQMSIAVYSGLAGTTFLTPMSASFLTNNDNTKITMERVGTARRNAGIAMFLNQIRQFDANTPIMMIEEAVNGTGMMELISDGTISGGRGRSWAEVQALFDRYGNDVTAIVHNWGTNDMGATSAEYRERLSALFLGTGPQAGDNSFAEALMPGWTVVISPLSRHTGNSSYVSNADTARTAGITWARTNGFKIGPPCSDYNIDDDGGAHATPDILMGGAGMAAHMGVAAARALGIDTSQQPYFTTATLSADGTKITVGVALPNGGNLFCPLPDAVKSFEVNSGGNTSWAKSGFTARVVENSIVLTKATGTWPAGTTVRYLQNLENRANGDVAAETAIIDSALYETWAPDVLGRGLLILGSMSGGIWSPDWSVTVQVATPAITVATAPTQARSGNTVTVTPPTFNVTPDSLTAVYTIDGVDAALSGTTYTLPPGKSGTVTYTATKAGYSPRVVSSAAIENPATGTPVEFAEGWAGYVAGNNWTQMDANYDRTATDLISTFEGDGSAPNGVRLRLGSPSGAGLRGLYRPAVAARCAEPWTRFQMTGRVKILAAGNPRAGIGWFASGLFFGVRVSRSTSSPTGAVRLYAGGDITATAGSLLWRSDIADSGTFRFRLEVGVPDKKTIRAKFWVNNPEPDWGGAETFTLTAASDFAPPWLGPVAYQVDPNLGLLALNIAFDQDATAI